MTKIDLITGFLGSGKTTFLKLYAQYLIDTGEKIGILENDFGAVNVDMMLLGDLEGDNCELEMVSGGCDSDCHARRFKTKLIALGMSGLDRVIVEPSGIFDVDEFFDALCEEPLNRMYEIGNVITIVDAALDANLSEESEYYLASQLANAGAILLSRAQSTPIDAKFNTISTLIKACSDAGINRDISQIIYDLDWFNMTASDFNKIDTCGYHIASYEKKFSIDSLSFSSVYFLDKEIDTNKAEYLAKELFNNSKYGNVFRVKGFYEEGDSWYELNATRNTLSINPITLGQKVIIVIGENLNSAAIEEALYI